MLFAIAVTAGVSFGATNVWTGAVNDWNWNEGGNFEGWFNALRDYGATHGWAGDNEYFHAQFAERVMRRFNNPGLFVPVVSRKVTDGQT